MTREPTPGDSAEPGRILGVDHVAIAVRSLDEKTELFRSILGVEPHSVETLPEHGVRVALFLIGKDRIELLEPLGENSPIAKFLEKRGEGLHHISLASSGIDAVLDRLDAQGIPLIDRAARPGAHGKRVAFLHPKGTGGILMELSEDD